MEWNGGGSFNGRPLSWSAMEKILSGKKVQPLRPVLHESTENAGADDGIGVYGADGERVGFAELHATSSYNFLMGASDPERLVTEAKKMGLSALSILDRDGFYGAVRFAQAAAEA